TSQFFSPGITEVKVAIFDDAGTSVWEGTAGVNEVRMIVGSDKRVTLIPAGIYGGTGSQRAAAFINLTGDPVTLDLVGANGLASHRGISPGPSFDIKKAVKLDARESSFDVTVMVKGAEPVELNSKVSPTYQYAVWKTGRGAYRLIQLGNLPEPGSLKLKKTKKK
ncbi:MAG: hypothetical protein H0T42_31980, partial [Deltaproteobacteria bacterium]|nr:hypothetical protein [Deltaproteobacteria bacterium]